MSEESAFKIIETLCLNGCKAYLTGGVVRDLFLGVSPNDYDVVTEATIEQINRFFNNVNIVGQSFEVCIINGIEVAGYRKDIYFGLSDKNCEIKPALSLEEDLARRDLTINSMAFCPYTNELIDPYCGKEDLKNKIIRFTGNPDHRIYEDPCRIVRACRFLGLIEGTFSDSTFEALKKNVNLISYISKERLRIEIFKALKYRKTSLFFKALKEIGALKFVFPSLNNCDIDGGKHHNETIFEHSMMVGDGISTKCKLVKLAGYLHDVGKLLTHNPENDSFIGHEKIGALIIRNELKDLKFSNTEIDKICNLTDLHMFDIKNSKSKGIRRFLKKLKDTHIHYTAFLRLKFADSSGNLLKGSYDLKQKHSLIDKIEEQTIKKENIFDITSLAINGNDVMSILNIRQGKAVGNYLKQLYELVLDNPELNTKEKLCQLLKNLPNNN